MLPPYPCPCPLSRKGSRLEGLGIAEAGGDLASAKDEKLSALQSAMLSRGESIRVSLWMKAIPRGEVVVHNKVLGHLLGDVIRVAWSKPCGLNTSACWMGIFVKDSPIVLTPSGESGHGQGHSSRPSPLEMCAIPILFGVPSGMMGEGIGAG